MSVGFAPAAWSVIKIVDGRVELLGVAPSAAEARRIARNIDDDPVVAFRPRRSPPPQPQPYDVEF